MNGPKHKLYHYEITPPPGVWEKLSAELDDAASGHSFPSTLYNHEVAPPSQVWNNITHSLDAEIAPPATGKGRVIPFLRYAAAAALIAFLAWGGLKLFNNKGSNTNIEMVQQHNSTKPKTIPGTNIENNSTATTPQATENTSTAEQDARDNAALEASKRTYAKLDMPASTKLKGVSDFYFAVSRPRGLGDFTEPEPEPVQNNIADRYIMLMTPDGNIIRMSKKLGSLVCCVSGEDQDLNCVDQMKRWREKLANSSVGHSSGNFMDILSLLSTLQGNDNQ